MFIFSFFNRLSSKIPEEIYLKHPECISAMFRLDILETQEKQFRVSDPFYEVRLKQQSL